MLEEQKRLFILFCFFTSHTRTRAVSNANPTRTCQDKLALLFRKTIRLQIRFSPPHSFPKNQIFFLKKKKKSSTHLQNRLERPSAKPLKHQKRRLLDDTATIEKH